MADNNKRIRITKDLIIKALAYDCPWRADSGAFVHCSYGSRSSNCKPSLCTHCTDIFRTMRKIVDEEIDIDI